MGEIQKPRYDEQLFALLPHRPPMLLINELISVGSQAAEATVFINEQTPFFETGLGVPSWIGLEYMGQTAALIAGYQLKMGLVEPHLGFLLGTRNYKTHCASFAADTVLIVSCREKAVVGESLATFSCVIANYDTQQLLASASLSVFRKTGSEFKNWNDE